VNFDCAAISAMAAAAHKPRGDASIHERHRTVVTGLEPFSQFPNAGPIAIYTAPDM
jgi:hypothetical protein